jgi:hypothetical protein
MSGRGSVNSVERSGVVVVEMVSFCVGLYVILVLVVLRLFSY